MLKIFSYNVNGIRAALKKGFFEWLKNAGPDIIGIQETKASREQIDSGIFEELGYHQYWHSAVKKGYSGVALFSKQEPDQVITGIGMPKYDVEGRLIRADFGEITLITSYFPSGSSGDVRQAFKMEWLDEFYMYIKKLKTERSDLIICGDINICHKPIDINHPERHKKSSGFLPEERAWMDRFIEMGFVDTFRVFNKEAGQYSWWSYRANSRAKNLGWRIDYFLITGNLKKQLISAEIHKDAVHSDHCPVSIDIKI